MKKILIGLGSVVTLSLPLLVLADNQVDFSYVSGAISGGKTLLSNIITLLFALAVVWFIWNVIRYSMSSEEDGKEKARSQMINGLIAIAVMASIWGIVGLLRGAFGVSGDSGAPNSINNMIPGVSGGSNTQPSLVAPGLPSTFTSPSGLSPLMNARGN